MCTLPCTRWLSPSSDLLLEYGLAGSLHIDRIAIPSDLKAPPGSTVNAVARAPHETATLGKTFEFFALCAFPLSVLAFAWVSNRGGESVAIALSSGVAVTGTLLTLGIYFRATSHPSDVVVERASSSRKWPRLALGSGVVEAHGQASGPRVVLTPLGVAGTF